MKDLIIAEKPSVANDLADSLIDGPVKKEAGYFESDDLVISWSVGHLLTLAYPQDYKEWKKAWRREQLPMIPTDFLIKPINNKRSKEQLEILKKLLNRKDIDKVINGCDAGREGELIFAYIYQYAKATKTVERLWLQSMTREAIKEAYINRLDANKYLGLEAAARSRSEADWLIGINGTQAATLALNQLKLDVISLGRVQTPTLAILQEREKEIKEFKPEPYSIVVGEFKNQSADSYTGEIKKHFSKKEAEKIVNACQGQAGTIKDLKTKETNIQPPLLFDLTSLQRQAGSSFGFTAKRTLSLAQRLYEHHKVISYPRTSSRFLPEDFDQKISSIAKAASNKQLDAFLPGAVSSSSFKRVFDDKKISDHFAIIPTEKTAKNLSDDEAKIYDLIRRRFLAVFMAEAKVLNTSIETEVKDNVFKTTGQRYLSLGWRAVEPGSAERLVPKLKKGDVVDLIKINQKDLETKPPKRYSDASLLGKMETAGRDLEDEELRELMKDSGLGTPATRSAIIERLIEVEYLERVNGKSLKVTDKGVAVIDILKGLDNNLITSAQLTGAMEKQLNEIEKNQALRADFIQEVAKNTTELVNEFDQIKIDPQMIKELANTDVLGPCPVCGKEVRENRRAYSCWSKDDPGCGFSIWKKVAGKKLPKKAVLELFKHQKTLEPVSGFKSKKGRFFKANLKLEVKNKKTLISFDEDWARDQES